MSYSVDNVADKVYLQRLFANNMVRHKTAYTKLLYIIVKKINKLF